MGKHHYNKIGSLSQFQQFLGNQVLQGLVKSSRIQPKLKISLLTDQSEREADRIASKIVNSRHSHNTAYIEDLRTSNRPKIDKQDSIGFSGKPLDKSTRAFMEPRFGYDLSGVRINTGNKPNIMNEIFGSLAFTSGNQIYFSNGAYSPYSTRGRNILAHELVHITQRNSSHIDKPGLGAEDVSTNDVAPKYNLNSNVIGLLREKNTAGAGLGLLQPRTEENDASKITIKEARVLSGERIVANFGDENTINVNFSKPYEGYVGLQFVMEFTIHNRIVEDLLRLITIGNIASQFETVQEMIDQFFDLIRPFLPGQKVYEQVVQYGWQISVSADKVTFSGRMPPPDIAGGDNQLFLNNLATYQTMYPQDEKTDSSHLNLNLVFNTGTQTGLSPGVSASLATIVGASVNANLGTGRSEPWIIGYRANLQPTIPEASGVSQEFPFNKSFVPEEIPNLKDWWRGLETGYPETVIAIREGRRQILIQGYASTPAKSEEYNVKISDKRASKAKEIIKGASGLPDTAFRVKTHGSHYHKVKGMSKDEQRVEVRIADPSKIYPP